MTRLATKSFMLSDLIDIKHGFAFQSEYFGRAGKYLLLTPGNFYEAGGFRDLGTLQKRYSGPVPTDFILRKEDILVAMTEQSPGLLGAAIRVPEGNIYLHNQRLGLVQIKRPDYINKGYLYHLFNAAHIRKEIATASSGTKVKHTSPSKMCSIRVPLPSISEQETVSSILDTWDAAIEKTERLIEAKRKRLSVLTVLLYRSSQSATARPFGSFLKESLLPGSNGATAKKLTVKLYGKGIVAKTDKYAGSANTNYYVRRRGQLIFSKLDFLNGAFGLVPQELDGHETTLDLPALIYRQALTLNGL